MKRVLAITQCFPCGSWICIEKIIEKMVNRDLRATVLGLGKSPKHLPGVKYFKIPYIAYTKYGNIAGYSPILGLLWNLPLYLGAIFLAIFGRYDAIFYNGLTSGLVLSPFFRLFGKKNIIMYHSEIGNQSKRSKKILKFLMKSVDLIVVNSLGSKEDILPVTEERKICVNLHYAERIFFDTPVPKKTKHDTLNVLYAGRIDSDKRCFPLIDFAEKMGNDPRFNFTFVGMGTETAKVVNLEQRYHNINYGGYVGDKTELAKLYSNTDVLWSFADTSYLGLPAVEALACGTPLIVPKYAAIQGKDELIDPTLVPDSIGWLVDPFDSKNVEKTLVKIQKEHQYLDKDCRAFARIHYSEDNILNVISVINKTFKSETKK